MTKSKNTKRALLASVLSVAVSAAMLVGSTFAWFTDSVTSGKNVIQAGNLDIQLLGSKGNSLEGEMLNWDAHDNRAQEAILWEPGCTYNTEEFYIKNNGNLNLKFKFHVSGIDGNAKLLEVIDFTAMADASWFKFNTGAVSIGTAGQFDLLKGLDVDTLFYGTKHFDEYVLEPGQKVGPFTLTGHMQETAGNDYQGLSIEGIAITLIATQATGEEDSFNGVYDEKAEYPVQNLDEFKDALNEAKPGETIALTTDIAADENLTIPEGVIIDGMGNTLITEAKIYANNGATIRSTNFKQPVNNAKNASFIYAHSLEKELVIENCTFVDTQWDAIQVTPKAGANIVIRNNVFKTTDELVSVKNGKCERYIHVQATGENMGSEFNVTITGNKFENIDKCANSVIDVDNLASKSTITVGNNSFSGYDVNESNLGDVIWIVTGNNTIRNEATIDDYNAFVADAVTNLK